MASAKFVQSFQQEKQGELKKSRVYKNVMNETDTEIDPNINTLNAVFDKFVRQNQDRKCLGYRPIKDGVAQDYVFETYGEVHGQIISLARALTKSNIRKGDKCGIFGASSVPWMLTMQALFRIGGIVIPIYDTLGEESVKYIIEHSEAKIVFVQASKLSALTSVLEGFNHGIKQIVYWGEAKQEIVAQAKSVVPNMFSFEEFKQQGNELDEKYDGTKPEKDDLAIIMYTSGTTGTPKGVMLTHGGMVHNIYGIIGLVRQSVQQIGEDIIVGSESYLSFLPLAHVLEVIVELGVLSVGGAIGYYQGNPRKLMDDLQVLKPTVFVGVPRVYERIYDGIQQKMGQCFGMIFNWMVQYKIRALAQGGHIKHVSPLLDRFIFSQVRKQLGGRVKLILSGAAPLSRPIEDYLRATMCCPLLQGYGLTECGGAILLAHPGCDYFGQVGVPIPGLEVCLEEVKELPQYTINDEKPQGEVLVRGPGLFTGYYKQDELTQEAIDTDGWYHTGDVGEINEVGSLKIIDRKKNIFKLAQGEYIAVERVESVLSQSSTVEQIWVYGNSFETYLVAIVVPSSQLIKQWINDKNLSETQVYESKELQSYIQKDLIDIGKKNKLKGFELVKKIRMSKESFSTDNDLMTASMKLKRPQLQKTFQKEIDEMYSAKQ